MKITSSALSSFLFFFALFVQAQEVKKVEDSYLEYFKLPRETLFLHTNKTTYLTDEDIWFKVYAFDRKNELTSKSTTNIYFGFYDSKGTQLDKRLYLAQQGAAEGYYKIDSLLPTGEYYLKVATNWMKNFEEDDSFIQKVQILNPKESRKENDKKIPKEYDFQFLPEGGHILEGVKNNIGIKTVDQEGKGTKSSGVILNSDDDEVARFSSNILGIGKFSFTPMKDEKYTAKVTLDTGKKFEKNLPAIDPLGVAISVNNVRKDKTIITLSLNEDSFNYFIDSKLKLVIHKDGKIKSIPVVFNDYTKNIILAKKDLFKGVNTITLFNENEEPLLERMFFNPMGATKNYELFLNKIRVDEDSITYKIQTKEFLGDDILNASISVLPSETISYNPDNTIISAIYLQPYIKGTIENPQYYFKNFNRSKQFELDVLLLTQGWSRYSWDRIFNLPPELTFGFENGFSINGSINSDLKNIKSLILYPTKYNGTTLIDFSDKGKFNIKNILLEKGEVLRFSATTFNGKTKRPIVYLGNLTYESKDYIVLSSLDNSYNTGYYNEKSIPENFTLDGYEELDEVNIVVKKKERLYDPQFPNAKITLINRNIARQYPYVTDFLQFNGFTVNDALNNGAVLGQVTITTQGRSGSSENGVSPVLFIDGALMQDFNILQTINMNQVEKILIDRSGVGLGISGGNGFGGVIKITTRKTTLFNSNAVSPPIFSKKIIFGFEPKKDFYAPKYISYRQQSFKNYGIIHWSPNINISTNGSDNLTTINTKLDEINFYIEGVSTNGTVFSQVVKVDNSKKP